MKNLNAKVLALALLLGAGTAAAQGVYRQQDADGRVTYTDRPETGAKLVTAVLSSGAAKAAPAADTVTVPTAVTPVELAPWEEARRAIATRTRMTSARALQIDLREAELRAQREAANRAAETTQLAQSRFPKSTQYAERRSAAGPA